MTETIDLDMRPTLRAGQEPFAAIMAATDALQPGQSLRLYATFRPVPLYTVMSNRGFSYQELALPQGEWEVIFTPLSAPSEMDLSVGSSPSANTWPDPVVSLDLADLPPPEPMIRILDAVEAMAPGDVLFAVLSREPLFLFPELAMRHHEWVGNFDATGTFYRIMIRKAAE